MEVNPADIRKEIEKYQKKEGILIPLLQDIQDRYGYVPEQSIDIISEELSIFPVDIYGILTFYAQFYTTPRGEHTIKVCQGTACHVMGGKEILDYTEDKLGISERETTKDGKFSLERVACLGCCGMAPVLVVDDDFYGNLSLQEIDELIKKY